MNMRKVLIWSVPVIIIVALTVSFNIQSQLEAQKAQGWGTESSYPGGVVRDIAIDSQQRIWVGSQGVSVFNGKNWTVYSSEEIGLTSYGVDSVVIDVQDRVWITKADGVSGFDGRSWHPYIEGSSDLDGLIVAIATDTQGRTWFGTNRNGVSVYDGQTWKTYTVQNSGLVSNKIRNIVTDDQGGVWIGTRDGLSHFDGQTWETYDSKYLAQGRSVRNIEIDPQGKVWVYADKSLSTFDEQQWHHRPIEAIDIAFDRHGRTWVGTYQGLSVLHNGNWTHYTPSNSGMHYPFVRQIKFDKKDRVWFVNDGPLPGEKSLTVFDGQSWQNFTTENSDLPAGLAFVIDSQNRLWMRDGARLVIFDDTQAHPLSEEQVLLLNSIKNHRPIIVLVLVILWIGALVDVLAGLGLTAVVSLLAYFGLIKLGFSPGDRMTLSPYYVILPAAIGGLLGGLYVKYRLKGDPTLPQQIRGSAIGFAIGTGLFLAGIILCRLAILAVGQ
jgi:ligand-binding sensor domain-containing protein